MKALLQVFLSVIFFVLGQPNVLFKDGLFFLSFFSLLPVFLAVEKTAMRRVFFLGFVYGFFAYGLMCFWVARYAHSLFFVAVISYAVLYGLCFLVMKFLSLCYKGFPYHVMALAFCSFEYLKSLGPLGFGYGIIGYSQWKFSPLLTAASVGGVWIASAFCAFFSASCANGLVSYREGKLRRGAIPAIALLLITVFFVMLGWHVSCRGGEHKDITVVLVQNGTDSSKYTEEGYKRDIFSLVSLTEEALSIYQDADFVVWPETSVVPPLVHHYDSRTDIARFNAVSSVLGLIARTSACYIIGNHSIDEDGDDCNTALIFDQEKGPVLPPHPDMYVKQHLVPFTESLPFYPLLKGLYDRFVEDRSFVWKAGEEPVVFAGRGISFSVPICFEDTFGSLCARFVKDGANCLFSICNDSWASSPVCQRQHLAMSVFRAAENGVPVLRSTASGVSCVIDRNGDVVEELEEFCPGFLGRRISVPTYRKPYPYTVFGDWFAILELCLFFFLLATACIRTLLLPGPLERLG